MNVLIVNQTQPLYEKLSRMLSDHTINIFRAETINRIAEILNQNEIDLVLMEIHSLSDVALLDFINRNYKDINLQLIADNVTNRLLTTLKEGKYTIFQSN